MRTKLSGSHGPHFGVEDFLRCLLGYNIGGAIFGGSALFLVQLLVLRTDDLRSPAYFLIATAVITLVALISIRKYAEPGEPLR